VVRIDPGNTAFTPLDFVAYPYSHSLLLLMVWCLVLGMLTRTHVGGRAAIPLFVAAPALSARWCFTTPLDPPGSAGMPSGLAACASGNVVTERGNHRHDRHIAHRYIEGVLKPSRHDPP